MYTTSIHYKEALHSKDLHSEWTVMNVLTLQLCAYTVFSVIHNVMRMKKHSNNILIYDAYCLIGLS